MIIKLKELTIDEYYRQEVINLIRKVNYRFMMKCKTPFNFQI